MISLPVLISSAWRQSDERGWGKQRHRGGGAGPCKESTSVSAYTTSGLVHIGHRREGEQGWVGVGGVVERSKRGNGPLLSLGHVGLLYLWES